MSEPATSASLKLFTFLGVITFIPWLDGNAAIGSFAGATLFVVSSKNLTNFVRVVYLVVSMIIGYLAVPDLMAYVPIKSSGVAAFGASALSVSIMLGLIERARKFDIRDWTRKRGDRQ